MGAKRPQPPHASPSESDSESEEEIPHPPSKKLAASALNVAHSSSASESEEENPNPTPPPKKPTTKQPTAGHASDQDSSESDGSDEEEDEGEGKTQSSKHAAKPKHQESVAAAATAKRAEKAESESESESSEDGSGSESDSPVKEQKSKSRPTRGPDPTIKPITSKPMEDSPKPKKPLPAKAAAVTTIATPSPLSSPAKPATGPKRGGAETNGKDSKRKRGAQSDNEEDEAAKKFARVWGEEDEIVFLKCIEGMKKASKRYDDVGALHEAVKNSINFDVTRGQIANKIRTLKKKYNNNMRNARRGGKELIFTKPHDKEVFEFSHKIWGNHAAKENNEKSADLKVNSGNADGKQKRNSRAKAAVEEINSPLKSIPEKPAGAEMPVVALGAAQKPVVEAEKPVVGATAEEESCRYPYIVEALNSSQNFWLNSLSKVHVRRALGLVAGSKASELEDKWRKLHMLQMEAAKMHSGLVQEVVDLLRDALMSEDGSALIQ